MAQGQNHRISWLAAFTGLAVTIAFSAISSAQTAPAAPPPITPAQVAFFEAKVRPVLLERCVVCHGATLQSGGVRLDNAADARKALVAGDSEKSRLIHAVRQDGAVKMPPGSKLPADQVAALTEWVKRGAPWPEKVGASKPVAAHWAFQPVRRPSPPQVKNVAWCASPIDRFVLAKLEAKGLTPAPPAGKRALIRRAYYDLVGLPPTPEAVETFVNDTSPHAYKKVVDGLLASPHYGERWARHWLDLARYADSNGLDENKAFANAWRYRDWVVSALNRDEPYDRFLQEQLAGDLMDSGNDETLRNERITATGFLTLGAKVLAEQDKPKLVMDIIDEQIDVTSKAAMGLTISCARCHDHKFDPISTKDYYALAGIFKSTKTMKNLGFVSEWNERMLTTREIEEATRRHAESMKPLEAALKQAKADADGRMSATLRRDADKYLKAGWELSRQPGVLLSLAESPTPPGSPERYLLEATAYARGNAVRDTESYGKGIGVLITDKAPVSAEWDVTLPSAGRYQVELRYAAEESRPVRLLVNGQVVSEKAAASVTGSWMPEGQRWEAQGVYDFAAGKNTLRIERLDGPIPHISRLLIVAAPPASPASSEAKPLTAADIAQRDGLIPEIVTRWAARLVGVRDSTAERARLIGDSTLFAPPQKPEEYYDAASKEAVKKAQDALEAGRKAAPQVPVVMAVEDAAKPEDVRIHVRGSTQNLGDIAPRGFPVVLVRACAPDPAAPLDDKGSGRLALARWLTRLEHPLTARVAVNRVWQHLFGAGLVRTPDNWGVKGEKPTHPELLDYLAATFVKEDGWSQKRLLRRLMLSSAYRMSAISPLGVKAAQIDPENRLLWHMNRRRLEAEPMRDALLAVAGTLDLTLGGSLLTTPDNDYVTNDQSKDQAQYSAPRRSLYLPVIRNSVYGLFQSFDFGDATTVNAHRASTTVAPQALFLLNSPLVRDASDAFAVSLLRGSDAPPTDDARVRRAYYRALSRPATPAEVSHAITYLTRYDAALASLETDPVKRRERVWQSYCQALFASNEFVYVE